ncbi:hypothetical protein [Streptomyces tendae]
MDLHAWITQQVDGVEAVTLAELEGRRVIFDPHLDGREVTGTIVTATYGSGELTFAIAQYGADPRDETLAPVQAATAVLRRCEADRRILAIHYAVEDGYFTACDGCGTAGICDDWVTENINDCPILLALAHAHGITDEILASLDRPTPPEPQPRDGKRLSLGDIHATPPITTSQVPAALRGPRWKP